MNKNKDLSDVRFSINMDRIKGLVNLSGSDIDARSLIYPFQTIGVKADICRTIVVFLHATFEDVLRTIARRQIDSAKSEDFLNRIPLIGLSNSGRAEKFSLGNLNAHRGKSVDQLSKSQSTTIGTERALALSRMLIKFSKTWGWILHRSNYFMLTSNR